MVGNGVRLGERRDWGCQLLFGCWAGRVKATERTVSQSASGSVRVVPQLPLDTLVIRSINRPLSLRQLHLLPTHRHQHPSIQHDVVAAVPIARVVHGLWYSLVSTVPL